MAEDEQRSCGPPVWLPGMETAAEFASTGPKEETQEESENEEQNVCTGLIEDECFHGMLSLEDLNSLLKTNGAFLIRTTRGGKEEGRQIVVSVCWNGAIKDVMVRGAADRGCTFDMREFKPTILELVRHHRQQFLPINADGIILGKPVKRQSWELRREAIHQREKIGEGAFGEVYKGTLKLHDGKVVAVAIKTPKTAVGKDTVSEAMKEARIQKDYVHPNVLRLYGVSAEFDPLMIVLEYVGGGSLDSYLKKHCNALSVRDKSMFCFDVTCGLDYLHERNCIHRDIAARNCLVCLKYGILKISDFGLSSVGNVQTLDRSKPAPIRWLAPEVLKTAQYAKPADIWSLAIVYWEIFTNALELPFSNYTLGEVQRRLCEESEFHPEMPSECSEEIKRVALKCWSMDPTHRPTADVCNMRLNSFAVDKRFQNIPGVNLKVNKKKKKVKSGTPKVTKEQTMSKEQLVSKEQSVKPSRKKSTSMDVQRKKSASRKSKKNVTAESREKSATPKKKSKSRKK